jgi:predicted RNase H-like HicB family nuclease
MTIETNIRIWREGQQFIAHALPIDLASAGDTPESARAAVHEAVELFIASARDQGTLDDVLEECGYTLNGTNWTAPKIVAQRHELLAV